MNQEATQMYGPQIEQMNQAGLVARAEGGPIYRQGGGGVDPFSVLDKYTSVGVPGVGGKFGIGVGGGTVGYERPAFGGDFSVGVTPGVGYDNYGQPSVQPSWNVGWRKEFNRGGPVYRQTGGSIGDLIASPGVQRVGEYLLRSGQNDPRAYEAFQASPAEVAAQKQQAKDLKTKEERAATYKESIDAAEKAKQYIDLGAGKVLNFIGSNWSTTLADSSLLETVSKGITVGVGWITGQERKAVDTAAHQVYGGTREWNAYKLFTQELRLLELKSRSLVRGGSISDAEAQAAAETIKTDYTDATTTKTQLDTVIARNNKALTNLGMEPYKSTAKASQVTGEPFKPGPKPSGGGSPASNVITEITDGASNIIDKGWRIVGG